MLTEFRLLLLQEVPFDEIEKKLPEHQLKKINTLFSRGVREAAEHIDDPLYRELFYTDAKSPARASGGRFIVLEGVDGAGKTTHIELLKKNLAKDGKAVYATAEPAASAVGGLIRDSLAGLHGRSASELAALFLADRIQHNVNPKNGIQRLLDSGVDVICDRYYYSSLAYQGIDSDIKWVADMNINCPDIRKPDACIFLDLPVRRSIERMSSDRLTSEIFETEEIIRRVKQRFADTFRMLNERENIYIVNADRPKDTVSAEIYEIVKGIK